MMRPSILGVLLAALASPASGQDSTFTRIPISLPQGTTYEAVAPADYDADGDLDLLVVRNDSPFVTGLVRPELYRNDGFGPDGAVFTLVPFPAPPYPAPEVGGDPYGEAVAWADFDNDGDVDPLVSTAYYTTLYGNEGDGTFTDSVRVFPAYEEFLSFYFAEPRSSAWADYDNDGDLDLALPATRPAGPFPSPDTTRLVLYRNDDSTFVASDTAFPLAIRDPDLTWGDVDGDGDLDLLYLAAGATCEQAHPGLGECLVIYRNDGGSLSPRSLDFPEVQAGLSDFGDFDLDGDLDILLVASLWNPAGPPFLLDRAIVYRNDGDTFEADTLEFPFTFDEYFAHLVAGQWADYDSDGDVDIMIGANVNDFSGPNPDYGGVAFVFANNQGSFSLTAALPASESYGTSTWADFDGDGDLDLLTTGSRVENDEWVYFAWLYRNEAPVPNAPPSTPTGLAAQVEAGSVALTWGMATDDHTPADALTYNLQVRPLSALDGSPLAARWGGPGGLIPAQGNVSLNRSWTLRDLLPGEYEWTVQAVDNALNAGAPAPEGTFSIGVVAGEPGPTPAALALRGVLPNPSPGRAAAVFDLPSRGDVSVAVFDALGREVLTVPAQPMEGGPSRQIPLDLRRLPAGVYLVQIEVRHGDAVARRTTRLTVTP